VADHRRRASEEGSAIEAAAQSGTPNVVGDAAKAIGSTS